MPWPSAIRTNFFQTGKDGQVKPLIAIKFESRKITDLPLPRPLYEIFVYSPRLEAVHLRFGKVARGGIRTAGPTAPRISAPKCSGWSRRSRSRTR